MKNKLAPPFRQAEFDILFNEGVSRLGELIDLGINKRIIERSGSWYSFNGERIGQGRENVRLALRDNPSLVKELEAKIREALSIRDNKNSK